MSEAKTQGKGGNGLHLEKRDVPTHLSARIVTVSDITEPATSAFPECPRQVEPSGGWGPDLRFSTATLLHPRSGLEVEVAGTGVFCLACESTL